MIQILFATLVALAFGIGFSFFGYRLFLVLLPVWGFFAGFWLGADVVRLLFSDGFLATTLGWTVGLVAGVLGAVLSYLMYMLGVALVAGGAGWALGSGMMAALGFESGLLIGGVALLSALLVVALALAFNLQKYVIIAITALGGANLLLLAILLPLGRVTLADFSTVGNALAPVLQDSWFWLLIWIALASAGVAVQSATSRTYTFQREMYRESWS